MQPLMQKHDPHFPSEFKYDNNKLNNLFKLANGGEWVQILDKISRDPNLVNATMKEGPDAGKTLLFVAAHQLAEDNSPQAESFIFEIFGPQEIAVDVNASPFEGPHRGKSIFWLLAFSFYKERMNKETELSNLLCDCFVRFTCNVNAAPQEGPFKGVTAYCLLTIEPSFQTLPFYCEIISPSVEPESQNINLQCNMLGPLLISLHMIANDLKGEYANMFGRQKVKQMLSNCYLSLMKIIEDNPYTNKINLPILFSHYLESNIPDPNKLRKINIPVELILSLPSSPDRNKLLVYFIFAGAILTDTALPAWKDEYDKIKQNLKDVFKTALMVFHYEVSSPRMPLDLIKGFVLNIIWSKLPELQDFPERFLLEKIAR